LSEWLETLRSTTPQVAAHGRALLVDPRGKTPRVNRFWRHPFLRYQGKRRHQPLYCGFNGQNAQVDWGRYRCAKPPILDRKSMAGNAIRSAAFEFSGTCRQAAIVG
jgi:hypothetical protein